MEYVGRVTSHSKDGIVGWCINKSDRAETVRLDLLWGDVFLRRIEASGANQSVERQFGTPFSTFSFPLSESLLSKIPAGTILRIRAPDGTLLQHSDGDLVEVIGTACDKGEALRTALADGWFIDKWGYLKLPFHSMPDQTRRLHANAIYTATTYFKDKFGIQLYPAYGTLLGYARQRSFLPHDDDADMSFTVESGDVSYTVNFFLDIVERLLSDGVSTEVTGPGQIKIYFSNCAGIDIFLSWWDPQAKKFTMYFGVHGFLGQRLSFHSAVMEGIELLVPDQLEELVTLTYGTGWRVPDPYFSWDRRIIELKPLMQELAQAAAERLPAIAARANVF